MPHAVEAQVLTTGQLGNSLNKTTEIKTMKFCVCSMYVRRSSMYKDILAHCFNRQHTHTHTHYKYDGDFPGCPVVKTLSYNAGSVSLISGRGAEIPHASWPEHQNIKQKQYCNKSNKDFENAPHQKKKKKP